MVESKFGGSSKRINCLFKCHFRNMYEMICKILHVYVHFGLELSPDSALEPCGKL